MKIRLGLLTAALAAALLSMPLATVAQTAPPAHVGSSAALVDCTGIAAWYARIPDPDTVIKQVAAAPADSSGFSYAAQIQILNPIVATLKNDKAVPAVAAAAQKELIEGYAGAVSSLSLWEQGIQSGAPGGIESLSQVLNAYILQSQSRNQVVDGYRRRAELAAICAVGPGAKVGAGCASVKIWMISSSADVKAMWDAIQQELDAAAKVHATEIANPEQIDAGALLAPPETWSNYFFTQALALAVAPVPTEAAPVNQEIVSQLIGESDLYLLDMMGIWTGYLGGDAETSQQISGAFTTESSKLASAYGTLQTDWAALAKTCGSTITLPNPPPAKAS